jgi:hypothetical protein
MALQCRQILATRAIDSGFIRQHGLHMPRFKSVVKTTTKPSTMVKSLQATEAYWLAAAAVTNVSEPAPGAVEAPISAIVVSAVIVTAAMLGISFLLKPGTDAAAEMQERDAKSGRWRK